MDLDLGVLTAAEQHAYRMLVRLGGAGADDLAAQDGLTPAEAAAALESLRVKGLVSPGPVFHALPPDVALGDALLRRQQALENARQVVAALSEDYRSHTRRRSSEHLVEIVVGARALRQRLRAMQDSAREEILWFCRANPIAMQGPENEEEGSALARGVRYRAIYERELLDKPGELASIVDSVAAGEEARTLPALPVRLAIADRELAICPLVPDESRGVGEPTAALIRSSELLDALVALFESYWERATPVGAVAAHGDLQESEVLLLSLVVSGMPDKSIATHLGVSKRTVQRRLDRLMDLAGVDTRTGLAFQAARRGWLSAPADLHRQPRP
ncbi:transcriptional regulator [Actinoplanes sp. NBRC 14428]|uniref:Sugar-specific transcriptional regulator TrmB n=1 Tax=Pseudosporangium ferrugineum TaxID=439699 RepID=A0A2T0RUA2_9ACTN|nr:helix-turn-helix domain-containing protein [Pseudosporangium ferrugineum]PRY24775.1 sugar-specific transcriptional regulator TrmB [Pseudosporangium ferrugineum]BCJ55029.1 transcriptional regulator [Actinoplanes sp. NBRC 14428]